MDRNPIFAIKSKCKQKQQNTDKSNKQKFQTAKVLKILPSETDAEPTCW